eukprot:XP_011672506.1 PREDICTED: uncharacterized protein LOC105442254 [Strongylocentrotus purpuratus]
MAVKIALAVGLFIVICGSPGLKSSQVIPDGLVYTEAKKILVRGAQGVLTCRFYGVPLAVYWRKGLDQSPMVIWQDGEVSGRRYDDGSCDVDENYSLIINNVSTANVGRMYCTVSNNKGPLMNNYTDILVVDTAITTNPQATLQMRQATFGILQCTVHIKARRVSWKKGTTSSANESLVVIENNQGFANRSGAGYDDGTYNITQEYSLVINELQIHHEGLYVCEVTDDTGISFRNHTFVNVVAQPLEPFPTVQECLNAKQHDPNYCILVAESGMTLTCQATKYYPSINLVFLYGSIVIKQSDTEEWENKDRTKNKTITIATRGNKELYTCVAFSIPGTNANTSTSVLLQGDVPVKSTMVIILVLCAALILISSVAYFIWRKKHHVSNPPDLPVRYSPIPGSAPHQELEGQVGDHIPSLTEEEIKRVAKEVKDYLAIHLCQIQADPLNSELVLEFKRIFTNLTLMEEDKGTKLKTPLPYDNLLRTKVNGNFPKRLLVEGEGGVGKTTFCAKIAWDWIHGKGYQDFKLVLVILLRKTEGKTVGEIVKSYLSDNNPVTAKQLDKHILSNPKDVFLVLDGLDELAVDLDSNQQIALITLNRLFKSGTVLITSRQWRSDEIRMNADLRKVFAFIAVEGFSAENLSSYITKFFHPDAASSEDLSQFISNNDVIRENMAPYPIYTAMLCIMWKEFDGERREAMSKLQTFSQLFNQMIDFLVDHHLSKHIPSLGIVGGKLSEHCSDIRHHLIHIGRIAFQGLLKRRLVFTEEEFQSYPESIDVGCKVGVLTREKKVLPRRDRRTTPNSVVQSVQFPHKLFQEYLSGMYLASLYNSNRNEYDRLISNIITKVWEYRYLLYFTSAQQKEVGLDIISRLIDSERRQGRIDDPFIVDVAYESQDQEVAKAVADHLSSKSGKELKITREMQAHTVSGHTFIMNHREVIETLNIDSWHLSRRSSASRDLAQFICKMPHLKNLSLRYQVHDDFFSTSSSMASSAKIETLNIDSWDLSRRSSASRDLAQFICKMPHLKNLSLRYQVHDDFFSTSSSMASSAKIEALDIEPVGQNDLFCGLNALAQFFKTDLTHRSQYHDDFYATLSSMASSSKCGNTSPSLTELTVDDETLKGWQGLGSMFDNVMRVTLQVRSTISYDVIQMIHLPGATELTIQTHDDAGRPACFYDELEPTTLRNALLNVSPQLVKVTFSDLDIGNSKMELILQAFRPPHSIKHLRSMRFIRCGTDLSMDDTTVACSQNQVMEVEMEHGKPRGYVL